LAAGGFVAVVRNAISIAYGLANGGPAADVQVLERRIWTFSAIHVVASETRPLMAFLELFVAAARALVFLPNFGCITGLKARPTEDRYDFRELVARLDNVLRCLNSIGISLRDRLWQYRRNIQRMLDAEAAARWSI
jgi:hypothetical protein